jgi:branched-chain amino acid transport system ATP-binding protein
MLSVRDMHSGYGRVPVLRGVDLEVEPGELVLLLGPNGAGKTTLLRTVAGFISPQSGTIALNGEEVGGRKPEVVARRGLRLVLEGHRVFPELTVADNLRLGQLALRDRDSYESRLGAIREIFPVLDQKLGAHAKDLSGGQQQILALAQGFVGDPKVLLCDEPSFGIAQSLVPSILRFLRGLADQGVAVVVVEQLAESALAVADRVVVLRRGSVVAEGPAREFEGEGRLKSLFLAS